MSRLRKFVSRDVTRLAVRYGWSAAACREIEAGLLANPESIERYWRNLAAARRAGYVQTAENGFLLLPEWCRQHGWPDPTTHDFVRDRRDST
jgi:hypothetical protein